MNTLYDDMNTYVYIIEENNAKLYDLIVFSVQKKTILHLKSINIPEMKIKLYFSYGSLCQNQ